MNSVNDSIAILVTTVTLDKPSLTQAEFAKELTEAKVAAAQDIVSGVLFELAKKRLKVNMRILIHQGGAPSKWERKVPTVGRLVAAGYLTGMGSLNDLNPSPDAHLLQVTKRLCPDKVVEGLLWFSDIRLLENPVLTKSSLALGRRPGSRENYIVKRFGESQYNELLKIWQTTFSEEFTNNKQTAS